MSKSKSTLVILAAVLAVIAYNFFSLYYPYISGLKWRDIKIDSLSLSPDAQINPRLAIENDLRIRLALFYQINKEDPLYWAPGLDTKELQDSVRLLAESQIELKKILKLKDDIYPVDFLKAFSDTATAQEKFSIEINHETARDLIHKERYATGLYREYAKKLRSKLLNSKLPTELFSQGGALTSRDIIIGDLEKVIQNSFKLDAEISARERCLTTSTIFCQRKPLTTFREYPDITSNAAEIFPARSTQSNLPFDVSGIYQIASPCWKQYNDSPEIHLLYALENKEQRILIPQMADNRYFEPLSPESFGEFLYDEYKRLGVEWKVTYMDNAYTCNNLEYQASLATINAYYKKYAQKPLFDQELIASLPIELQKTARQVGEYEEEFKNEKYPSEVTLGKISEGYAKIYNALVIVGTYDEAFADELLTRFQFANNKLADWPKNLNFLSLRNYGHAKISEVNIKGQVEMNYVYFMRNAYGITLFGFSPSVWQSRDRLQYIAKDTRMNSNLLNNSQFIEKFGLEYAEKVESITREMIIDSLSKTIGKDLF